MIISRCLNSVLRRSASNSCYNSVSRNHSSLIAYRSSTKQLLDRQSTAAAAASVTIPYFGENKRTMTSSAKPTLTLDSINPNVIKMEYAVRGPLVIRAGEIEKEIKQVRSKSNYSHSTEHLIQFCFCAAVVGFLFSVVVSGLPLLLVPNVCMCQLSVSQVNILMMSVSVLLTANWAAKFISFCVVRSL